MRRLILNGANDKKMCKQLVAKLLQIKRVNFNQTVLYLMLIKDRVLSRLMYGYQ